MLNTVPTSASAANTVPVDIRMTVPTQFTTVPINARMTAPVLNTVPVFNTVPVTTVPVEV